MIVSKKENDFLGTFFEGPVRGQLERTDDDVALREKFRFIVSLVVVRGGTLL